MMTIGAKLTKKVDNDMLVIDGFKLFYLGAPKQTAIRDVNMESLSNEVKGYYNLNGQRIAQPGRGITIVKFKDGRSVKVQ